MEPSQQNINSLAELIKKCSSDIEAVSVVFFRFFHWCQCFAQCAHVLSVCAVSECSCCADSQAIARATEAARRRCWLSVVFAGECCVVYSIIAFLMLPVANSIKIACFRLFSLHFFSFTRSRTYTGHLRKRVRRFSAAHDGSNFVQKHSGKILDQEN